MNEAQKFSASRFEARTSSVKPDRNEATEREKKDCPEPVSFGSLVRECECTCVCRETESERERKRERERGEIRKQRQTFRLF